MSEKQNIKDYTEEKEKIEKTKKSFVSAVKLAVAVIAILLLCFVFGLSGFTDKTENSDGNSSVISSDGFPLSFTSNDIITADSFSSRMFVLTSKQLTCVKSDATVDFTKNFTFVEPELTVSEKYGMIYDRSSSKYIIFNSKGVVYEGKTEGERHIITAAIDNRGNCAIVTKSEDSACRVYYVSKSGNIRYIWSCAEEYVVCLDISSDGKEILCGAIGASNGEILTKVYKLETSSAEKEKSFSIYGSGCVDIGFYGKDKAIISCLDKRVIVDMRTEDGAPTQAEYTTQAIYIDSDFNGYTAVVTDKINSFDSDEITLYDKNNSVIYKTTLPQGTIDVYVKGKTVYCLTNSEVLCLNSKGEIKSLGECESRGNGMVILNKNAYYYTAGKLYSFD